jgi:hypothetical protein
MPANIEYQGTEGKPSDPAVFRQFALFAAG